MQKPVIYISRKIPDSIISPYMDKYEIKMWHDEKKPVPREILLKEVKQADGLLCLMTEKIDREFLNQASHLNIIANMAVGYDNIDIEAAKEYGVTITNTPDVLTETTADLTFALLMATARRIVESSQVIYDDKWGDWSPFYLAGKDIHHSTIGIVGMGRIGEAVAKRARGFNMEVLYHNRTRKETAEKEIGVQYCSFDVLVERADFVVSLLPLTDDTADKFNHSVFKKMKDSAIFINVSRGGVVDEAALFEALKHGTIKAAGLDVFKDEPIKSDHPFTSLPNAVLLPHIGSATIATRENMIKLCLDNIEKVFRNEPPQTPVT